jgi:hypothetical protein
VGKVLGKIGKYGCLLPLVVIGALVVIVVIIAAIAASGHGSAPTPDVHAPLANGSSATVTTAGDKQHKVTIVQIQENATSTNEFERPPSGQRYYALTVVVENPGKHEISLGDWKLRATDGSEYDDTIVSGLGDLLPSVMSLTPGGKTQGVVVFAIPATAQVQWIRYDPNPFAKGDLYFDAR